MSDMSLHHNIHNHNIHHNIHYETYNMRPEEGDLVT